MTRSAKDIYQGWLDYSSKIFFDGAFEELADLMVYPHTMETTDGVMQFNEPNHMVEAARDFRDYLSRMHTQDYLRVCSEARFTTPGRDQIVGVHETYVLQGGAYVVEPFRNEMLLQWDEDAWKGGGVRASVSNVDVPILSPKQLRDRALAAAKTLTEDKTND